MNHETGTIFTIGHSNHSLDLFLSLLEDNGIQVLADVRSRPYSRYVPHFNKPAIETAVQAAGIEYLFLGRELGGRRKEKDLTGPDGRLDHAGTAGSPLFRKGISRLLELITDGPKAIMCAEEDPLRCHRYHLIAPVLTARGVAVKHIRGDGRVQTQEDLLVNKSRTDKTGGQLDLF